MLRFTLIAAIKCYQTFSLLFKSLLGEPTCSCCRFTPSCSAYATQAIQKHGVCYGSYLTFCRLLRCHPWAGKCGYDPVPNSLLKSRKSRSIHFIVHPIHPIER